MSDLRPSDETQFRRSRILALRHDVWVRAALAVLVAQLMGLALLGDSLPSLWLERLPTVCFAALLFASLRSHLNRIQQRDERLFWKDLAVSSGAWLGVAVLQVLPSAPWLSVVGDLLNTGFFVVVVLALERRPHRRHPWRPGTLDRSLSWPALLAFVVSLLAYLVVQPILFKAYQGEIASTWLSLVLNSFLAIRLVLAAIKATSWRWQTLYLVLAAGFSAAALRGIWFLIEQTQAPRPTQMGDLLLTALPWLLLILAARLRFQRFPADALIEEERSDAGISSPGGQGMVFVLVLPLMHFSFTHTFPDAVDTASRELLLLAASVILGSLAYLQYMRLRDAMENLRRERSHFEEDFLESEKDLRLIVEQKQTAVNLSTYERNFGEIFHRNPEAIAICSLEDGEFLEVNDAFAKLFGFATGEMQGRTALELGLLDNDDLGLWLNQLSQQESSRHVDFRSSRRDGGSLALQLSTQKVEIDGQPCVLIVSSSPEAEEVSETVQRAPADWLEAAEDAAWVVDPDGNINYWNRAATELFGWSVKQILRQPLEMVLPQAQHILSLDEVRRRGHWSGGLQVEDGDEKTCWIQCHIIGLEAATPEHGNEAAGGAEDRPLQRSYLALCRRHPRSVPMQT